MRVAILCLVWLLAGMVRAEVPALSRAETFARALTSDPPSPPSADEHGQLVALPDELGRRLPGIEGVVWYRFRFAEVARERRCAVYLPHAHANVVAYLNGEWLGQGGRFHAPAAHVWNRPLLFELDCQRLRNDNVLELGLQADGALYNRLDAPRIGSSRELRPMYERAFAARIPPAEASTVLSAAIFIIFAYVGLVLRERAYGALAACAGCYVIASLNLHLLSPPISSWTFNTVTNLFLQWSGFALAHLGFVWSGAQRRWLNATTLGLVLATGTIALVLPPRVYERVMIGSFTLVALYAVASFVAIWQERRSVHRPEWITYAVTWLVVVPMGLHDIWLLSARQRGTAGPEQTFCLPYFGPIMLIAAGASLLMRFMRVYKEAQQASADFERQLVAKTQELESHHAQVREIGQRRVLLQERERFMREIHDGVGSHLVAALALLEQPGGSSQALSETLRDGLSDLRLMVDALDPQVGDMPMLLADFRRRLEPRLRARGISLRWQMPASFALPALTPFEALQVLRILQEAVTNVLKHAHACALDVRCGAHSTLPYVEIEDDGPGIPDQNTSGRGLGFMRQRAERIGATLDIDSGANGTRIRLTLAHGDIA